MATPEVVSATGALIIEENPLDETIIVQETIIIVTKDVVAEPESEPVTEEDEAVHALSEEQVSPEPEESIKDEVKEIDLNHTEEPNETLVEDKPVTKETDTINVETPVVSAPETEVTKDEVVTEKKPIEVEKEALKEEKIE